MNKRVKDKRKAFIRLAEQRTNKVLKAIDVLSNCSNPHLYEWTDEEVEAIFQRIEEEIQATKGRFEKGGEVFHLGDEIPPNPLGHAEI